MAAVNTFFEKHSDIYNSDESRQEFAKSMLDMNRFAYRKADGNKKSVSQLINSLLYLLILCIIEIPRRVPRPPHYTGFFCSFHLTAMKGSKWLRGLYPISDEYASAPLPRPALALATAAVSTY